MTPSMSAIETKRRGDDRPYLSNGIPHLRGGGPLAPSDLSNSLSSPRYRRSRSWRPRSHLRRVASAAPNAVGARRCRPGRRSPDCPRKAHASGQRRARGRAGRALIAYGGSAAERFMGAHCTALGGATRRTAAARRSRRWPRDRPAGESYRLHRLDDGLREPDRAGPASPRSLCQKPARCHRRRRSRQHHPCRHGALEANAAFFQLPAVRCGGVRAWTCAPIKGAVSKEYVVASSTSATPSSQSSAGQAGRRLARRLQRRNGPSARERQRGGPETPRRRRSPRSSSRAANSSYTGARPGPAPIAYAYQPVPRRHGGIPLHVDPRGNGAHLYPGGKGRGANAWARRARH